MTLSGWHWCSRCSPGSRFEAGCELDVLLWCRNCGFLPEIPGICWHARCNYFYPSAVNDALPYPLNIAADLSAVFEMYSEMQKELKAALLRDKDTAENLYTSPA